MLMIEVVFCPEQNKTAIRRNCTWFSSMTVSDVLNKSGIIDELDPAQVICTGIFSKPVDLSALVQPGDRIEIYRPLYLDPKEIRRKRAKSN